MKCMRLDENKSQTTETVKCCSIHKKKKFRLTVFFFVACRKAMRFNDIVYQN